MSNTPNVLVIVLDCVRPEFLGCYSGAPSSTPNLQHLAETGRCFKNAYTTSSWSLPSHASIFTGLNTSKHQMLNATSRLPEGVPTVASVLKKDGYDTVGITNNCWVKISGLDYGFDQLKEVFREPGFCKFGLYENKPRMKRYIEFLLHTFGIVDNGAELTNKLVREWISNQKSSNEKRKPFFMFINYMEAHYPFAYSAIKRDNKASKPSLREIIKARNVYRKCSSTFLPLDRLKSFDQNTFLSIAKKWYRYAVEYLDERLGELFNYLKNEGILDDTLIIVTSDHGEHFGEHSFLGYPLLGHQLNLYNLSLKVPLMLRLPGCVDTGWSDRPVQLTDIFPTILNTAQIDARYSGSHQELPDLLKDNVSSKNNRTLFAECLTTETEMDLIRKKELFCKEKIEKFKIHLRSAWNDSYKLICDRDRPKEFFDIKKDPYEKDNLVKCKSKILMKSKQELFDALVREFNASDTKTLSDETQKPDDWDEIVKERLKSLGYL
jgi:arylsulfatase A-like enzyme